MARYLTRLSFNRSNWQRPTGEARQQEEAGTYNESNGFGHEDWLFRYEWLIDGWHYGFIQGVNHSYARLSVSNETFDVILFTIDDRKRRRFVAKIMGVECLSEVQAQCALEEFMRRGWYDTMLREIEAAKGNANALNNVDWAPHALNVRFRWENIWWFPSDTFAEKGDPVFTRNYYVLNNLEKIGTELADLKRSEAIQSGRETPYSLSPYLRRSIPAVECTPEHERMKEKLLAELNLEFPKFKPVCESESIDVTLETHAERILFEIKSDLDARTVIRRALGQILEYAFHPSRTNPPLRLRLVIVGRCPLSPLDQQYFGASAYRILAAG